MTTIAVPKGSLALSGKNVALEVAQNITISSLVLTGYAPSRAYGLLLTPHAPTVVQFGTTLPSTVALALTTFIPSTFVQNFRSPGAGSLTITGLAPTIVVDHLVLPAAQTLTLAGQSLTVDTPDARAASPGRRQLNLNPEAPILQVGTGTNIGVPKGGIAFAGKSVTALTTVTVFRSIPVGSINLAGIAPILVRSTIPSPGVGALSLAGSAPVDVGSQVRVPSAGSLALIAKFTYVAAPPLVLSITGQAPSLVISISRRPAVQDLVLQGRTPTLVRPDAITVPEGAIVLDGKPVTKAISSAFGTGDTSIVNLTVKRELVPAGNPHDTVTS